MSKKKRLLVLFVAVSAAGLFAYFYNEPQLFRQESEHVLRLSGNIEVREAELSFKIPGRVIERIAEEGQLLSTDVVAAKLDSVDLEQQLALRKAELHAAQAALAELEAGFLPEEIAQMEAAVSKAQARLDELLAGSRPEEIASAKAAVASAGAVEEHMRIELERQSRLLASETISQREYDKAISEYSGASARLKSANEALKLVQVGPRTEQIAQARAALTEAEQQLALMKKGPRQEKIEQARARVEQASAACDFARTQVSHTLLYAPFSGMVLSENVEVGEYVSPGTPVITLGDLENTWLRAYIAESDLGKVKYGQKVHITTDSHPGNIYTGHISFIASESEFTPKTVQTQKERVKLVYRIKVDVPNPELELKPGMPVDAAIQFEETDK